MLATTCLAFVIFFEAGIEPPEGMAATGWVAVNHSRVIRSHNVCREVRYTGRYASLRKNHVFGNGYQVLNQPHGAAWCRALHTARAILRGDIPDPTGGATHFECTRWRSCKKPPPWARFMEYRGQFGSQVFYKERRHV